MIRATFAAIAGAALALGGCTSETDSFDDDGPADRGALDLAAASAQGAERVPSECASEEETIFACTKSDGGLLRICGVEGEDGSRFAQYRFGPPGGVAELALPLQSTSQEPGWSWASVPYSGGGEQQVRFAVDNYEYVVYSRVVRTRFDGQGNEPRFTDGVAILRDGDLVANRSCVDEAEQPVDASALQALMPAGEELYTYELED